MISPQLLQRIALDVANIFGWAFKEDRLEDLARGLMETARELGIRETPGELQKWLENISWTAKELDILASHLTVGETYFFREKALLDVFKDKIIPEIIRNRAGGNRPVRIWSAGCCSGEEPYTLAMLLKESVPNLRNRDIHILGTDINRHFIAKAALGAYTSWSFRETPDSLRDRYFSPSGNTWQIDPAIRNQVGFSLLNLAEDRYPSESTGTQNMDVIFCRNVLMYFTREQIRMVVRRFYESLNDDGWLIVGAVDLNTHNFSDFHAVRTGTCTVYQKSQKPAATAAMPAPAEKAKMRPAVRVTTNHAQLPGPVALNFTRQTSGSDREWRNFAMRDAAGYFNRGLYEPCASACESIVQKEPHDIEILTMLVRSKANLGLLEEAGQWARKLALHPGANADHFYLIANILLEKKDIASAEGIFKRALYLDPHHLMSHFFLGTISSQLENKHRATRHFQNVRDLLGSYEDDSLVPGSDGMTAGRLRKILSDLI